MEKNDFLEVTEVSGELVSEEQISRIAHRYLWATQFCANRDVLEVACGTGQGLAILGKHARTLKAGDLSGVLLDRCRKEYGTMVELARFDAQHMPYPDYVFDVIMLAEALYYIPSAERFVAECRRVLRPNGKVLIVTANKDLFDFNPSPHSYKYYGVKELGELFTPDVFHTEFFGHMNVEGADARQKILRPIKALAASLGLIPKTMGGKKFLKRLVFGKLVPMPARVSEEMIQYLPPTPLTKGTPDRTHKVIYCKAELIAS